MASKNVGSRTYMSQLGSDLQCIFVKWKPINDMQLTWTLDKISM